MKCFVTSSFCVDLKCKLVNSAPNDEDPKNAYSHEWKEPASLTIDSWELSVLTMLILAKIRDVSRIALFI